MSATVENSASPGWIVPQRRRRRRTRAKRMTHQLKSKRTSKRLLSVVLTVFAIVCGIWGAYSLALKEEASAVGSPAG